jgi:ribosomal protein S14
MDSYKRSLYLKKEIKRSILKSVKLNRNTFYYRRYLAAFLLSKLPRFSSVSYKRNRCLLSARSYGNNKITGCSRFVSRQKIHNAELPGFSRYSW